MVQINPPAFLRALSVSVVQSFKPKKPFLFFHPKRLYFFNIKAFTTSHSLPPATPELKTQNRNAQHFKAHTHYPQANTPESSPSTSPVSHTHHAPAPTPPTPQSRHSTTADTPPDPHTHSTTTQNSLEPKWVMQNDNKESLTPLLSRALRVSVVKSSNLLKAFLRALRGESLNHPLNTCHGYTHNTITTIRKA